MMAEETGHHAIESGPHQESMQFQSLDTLIDTEFWLDLRNRKLHEWKLDSTVKELTGVILLPCGTRTSGHFSLRNDAFNVAEERTYSMDEIPTKGELYPVNTLNEFRQLDKKKLLSEKCLELVQSFVSSDEILHTPEQIYSHFICVTYVDLVNNTFVYWFCFPSVVPKAGFSCESPVQPIGECLSTEEINSIDVYLSEERAIRGFYSLLFMLEKDDTGVWKPKRLSDLSQSPVSAIQQRVHEENLIFGILDTSDQNETSISGTICRNAFALIMLRFGLNDFRCLLCYLNRRGKVISESDSMKGSIIKDVHSTAPSGIHNSEQLPEGWNASGWQLNHRGKPGPRTADLKSVMDPQQLAYESVFLNLSLMKWRAMPSVDLELHKSTRCLLLGAGTLGCNVARVLLGWGFQHITFVDNGRVSYSNPVRQPLYEFSDAFREGQALLKTEAAVVSLKKIFPGVQACGEYLSIPMPGHCDTDSSDEEIRKDALRLLDLIRSHDVVFLLTDTRESRWLPTLYCSHLGKPAINVALGFDTFLVMRHGIRESASQLGCYFCSDVVAPTNSTREQTLDQQCTVTRPGLAAMASAIAVELLVNCMHHPSAFAAEAETLQDLSQSPNGPLGTVPHQLRGYLSHFAVIPLMSPAFDRCAACSERVLNALDHDQMDFVLRALKNPEETLEQIAGLTQLKERLENEDFLWESD